MTLPRIPGENAWRHERPGGQRRPRPLRRPGVEALEPRILLSGDTSDDDRPISGDVAHSTAWVVLSSEQGGTSTDDPTAALPTIVDSPAREDAAPRLAGPFDPVSLPLGRAAWDATLAGAVEALNIYYESGEANDVPGSAELIPEGPVHLVIGRLSQDDRIDFFRVFLPAETANLSLQVKSTRLASASPGRLVVMDEGGKVLGEWPIPEGDSDFSVSFDTPQAKSDTTLLVGVMADSSFSSAEAPPQAEYALQIQLGASPGGGPPGDSDFGGNGPPSSTPEDILQPPPPEPPPTSGGPDRFVPTSAGGEFTVAVSGPVGVVVGPMPTVSAGPLGGNLADVDVALTLEGLGAVAPELAWLDLLWVDAGPESDGEPEPEVQPTAEEEPPSVIVLQSPGGFPVLAGAVLSNRPSMTDEAAGACLPELPDLGEPSAPAAAMTARAEDAPTHRRRGLRGSIAITLHVATLMAMGALLPDLYSLLRAREPRRPTPRVFRSSRRRTEG